MPSFKERRIRGRGTKDTGIDSFGKCLAMYMVAVATRVCTVMVRLLIPPSLFRVVVGFSSFRRQPFGEVVTSEHPSGLEV